MSSDTLEPVVTPASRPRLSLGRNGASLLSLVVSAALLVALYRSLDVSLIGQVLLRADRLWLVLSVGMILPITLLRAVRFYLVAPPRSLPGVGEALRLTLVSSALNVFLPTKAGDLIKSYFVAKRSATPVGVAVAIVVYERLCDLFGLIAWCLLGWVVGRPDVPGMPSFFWPVLAAFWLFCGVLVTSPWAARQLSAVAQRAFASDRLRKVRELAEGWPGLLATLAGRRRLVVSFSMLLWFVHLFQIWMFTVALSASVPFTVCASLSTVALMAGQLPFTFAGLGSTDVALVVLLSRYMPAETAAAMGVLISTRGLLPPLLGLPMMRPYLSTVVGEARRWRRGAETAE